MILSLQSLRSWFPDCRMANIMRKLKKSEPSFRSDEYPQPASLTPPPKNFIPTVTFRSTTEINIYRMFIELGQHYNTLYTVAYLNLSSLFADAT